MRNMYKFTNADGVGLPTTGNIIELLKLKWDELHDQSHIFNYKITNLEEIIIEDKYLLQLNPNRGSNRRMPQEINNMSQPFDKKKFNFTKVPSKEILFNLVKQENGSDKHSVIINASPITRYHSLLCPSISKCLPQVVTEASLVVVLDTMFLAQHRDLRIGFNSLCALASVNHLHYHMLFESSTLPVETVKCKHLKGPLFYFDDYPVPAFCFHWKPLEPIKDLSKQIYQLLSYFLKNFIAHNMFITWGDNLILGEDKTEVIRIIIWPRKSTSGAKQLGAFNVACCELSGHFPIYEKTAFQNLTKETLEQELRKWKIDNFHVLCEEVKSIF